MVAWWVVALAILFPLAQVPLVLWIGRYFALDDDEDPVTTEARDLWTEHEASPGRREERGAFDPEEYDLPEVPSSLGGGTRRPAGDADGRTVGVVCPDCGAENETDYRFCGDCAAELG